MMEKRTGDLGSMDDAALETLRIDKWLWAARFFKTRSLAARAVSGGLVQVAEQRVKASRRLRRGELVHIRRGLQAWDVVVTGLREQRRPAPEARTLYEETPESVERRTSEEGPARTGPRAPGAGTGTADEARAARAGALAGSRVRRCRGRGRRRRRLIASLNESDAGAGSMRTRRQACTGTRATRRGIRIRSRLYGFPPSRE